MEKHARKYKATMQSYKIRHHSKPICFISCYMFQLISYFWVRPARARLAAIFGPGPGRKPTCGNMYWKQHRNYYESHSFACTSYILYIRLYVFIFLDFEIVGLLHTVGRPLTVPEQGTIAKPQRWATLRLHRFQMDGCSALQIFLAARIYPGANLSKIKS